MRELPLKQTPKPWQVLQIHRFTIAPHQPTEDPDDFGMPLRAEDGE